MSTKVQTEGALGPLPEMEVDPIHICDDNGPPYCGAHDGELLGPWNGRAEQMCPECLIIARWRERMGM